MNVFSLICITLLYSGFPAPTQQIVNADRLTQPTLLASSFIPPDRGVPGRRQGGGTR